MLKQFEKFKDLNDVRSALQHIRDNISLSDLNPGEVRTEVPTADSLEKGKQVIVEENGVPAIYYRALDGSIHKFTGTVVS